MKSPALRMSTRISLPSASVLTSLTRPALMTKRSVAGSPWMNTYSPFSKGLRHAAAVSASTSASVRAWKSHKWARQTGETPVCPPTSSSQVHCICSQNLGDARPKVIERRGDDLDFGLSEVEKLEHVQVVEGLEAEVEHDDHVVHAEVDACVYLVPAHAVDEDAAPLLQPARRDDESMLAQLCLLLGGDERLDAALRIQPAATSIGELGVEVGVTRAVEAGRAILGPKRLVECLTEALFAHVQTGGQPGRFEIGAQHVLEL